MTTHVPRTDHELKLAIVAELEWAPDVVADHVGVGLTDGAVTLCGQVASYPERVAAVRAVLRVRGVTAVADEIVVRDPAGDGADADIARDAAAALERSTSLPAGSVKAEVHDQVVTLTGALSWHYQRSTAVNLVAGLPGVRDVVNEIVLQPQAVVSPVEAEASILAALQRSALLNVPAVKVSVNGSVITLTGTVSTWAERHEAEFAAWCTPGVTHVDDRLDFGSPAEQPAC
ncbi:BON domain-containing protein [Acidothermaceae bacterium B102]|nr:BON domain-containing protein [Acidothermaceae bacterium B102]